MGTAALGALAYATLVGFGSGQVAQLTVSLLWTLAGTALLLAGLARDRPPLRRAGLALLAVAVGKVLLHDLVALTSLYRVGALVGIGALLLAGAWAWQRTRPRAIPDLRRVTSRRVGVPSRP